MSRRKDAKTALLHTRQQELRTLVQYGRMDEAMESAQRWGLDVDAVLDAVGQEPGSPIPPIPSAVQIQEPAIPTPPEPEPAPLWPDMTDIVVVAHPTNKRLYIGKLNDGRRVNVWRMGSRFPVSAGFKGKLFEMVGDQPYYAPIAL